MSQLLKQTRGWEVDFRKFKDKPSSKFGEGDIQLFLSFNSEYVERLSFLFYSRREILPLVQISLYSRSVQCAVYSVQCAVFSVQCEVGSAQCEVYSV